MQALLIVSFTAKSNKIELVFEKVQTFNFGKIMVESNHLRNSLILWSIPLDLFVYDFQIALIEGFNLMFLNGFMRYTDEELPLCYDAHVEA